MEGEAIGTCLRQGLYVVLGMGHHEVAVEMDFLYVFAKGGDDRGSDGEIGNEMA